MKKNTKTSFFSRYQPEHVFHHQILMETIRTRPQASKIHHPTPGGGVSAVRWPQTASIKTKWVWKWWETPKKNRAVYHHVSDLEVSWNGATPSHHPFLDGDFPEQKPTIWGYPIFGKPPFVSWENLVWNCYFSRCWNCYLDWTQTHPKIWLWFPWWKEDYVINQPDPFQTLKWPQATWPIPSVWKSAAK